MLLFLDVAIEIVLVTIMIVVKMVKSSKQILKELIKNQELRNDIYTYYNDEITNFSLDEYLSYIFNKCLGETTESLLLFDREILRKIFNIQDDIEIYMNIVDFLHLLNKETYNEYIKLYNDYNPL